MNFQVEYFLNLSNVHFENIFNIWIETNPCCYWQVEFRVFFLLTVVPRPEQSMDSD